MNNPEITVEVLDSHSCPSARNTYVFNCPYCRKQTLLEHVTPIIESRVVHDLSKDPLGNPYLSKDNTLSECVTEYVPDVSIFRCHNCKEYIGPDIYELATNGKIKFNENESENR